MLLVFELWPAPRTLYSAEISPIYDRIAADPRPVRVLVLPFGVRDGTWETGNFRPRTLFNQTRHGKALIGGYLSRVSPRRVQKMRQDYPTLDALITLSERAPIGPEIKARLDERGDRLVTQGNVGYVVIDSRFIPPDRAQLVIDALKLREVQRDQHLTLYVLPAHRTVSPKRTAQQSPDARRRMILCFVMRRGPFLVLFAVSGAAALIYEVVWTRLLTLHMGHGLAAASAVLAAFMGGLAAGAGAAGRYAGTLPPRRALDALRSARDRHRRPRGADAVAAARRPSVAGRRPMPMAMAARRLRSSGWRRSVLLLVRAGCLHGRDLSDRVALDRAHRRDRRAGRRRAVCRQHPWRRSRRGAGGLRADSGARITRHDIRRRRAQPGRGRRRVDARVTAAVAP